MVLRQYRAVSATEVGSRATACLSITLPTPSHELLDEILEPLEEPIGRARWVGTADDPPRRSRPVTRRQAGLEFVTRSGEPSDWHPVHSLDILERFEVHPDFEVEWYA